MIPHTARTLAAGTDLLFLDEIQAAPEASERHFKCLYMDVGLMCAALHLNLLSLGREDLTAVDWDAHEIRNRIPWHMPGSSGAALHWQPNRFGEAPVAGSGTFQRGK